MNTNRDVAMLIGRIMLSVIFIMGGWGKIVGFDGTVVIAPPPSADAPERDDCARNRP